MKYLLLVLLLLPLQAHADVTVDMQYMPSGCEKKLLQSCEGELFTYHYTAIRKTVIKEMINGVEEHHLQSDNKPVTFGYFVWNRPHGTDPSANNITDAAKMADAEAQKHGVQ